MRQRHTYSKALKAEAGMPATWRLRFQCRLEARDQCQCSPPMAATLAE